MRLALITSGTRGDAQPLVVLGMELARRGHEVSIGVPPNLVGFARAAGLDAAPTGPDTQAFMESPEGQGWLAAGKVGAFTKALFEFGSAHLEQSLDELTAVTSGADLIVSGVLWEDVALPMADRAGVPLVTLHSAPYRRSRALPAFLVTTRRLPGPVNQLTHSLFERAWWRNVSGATARARTRLELPPSNRPTAAVLADRDALELQVYSPALTPGLEQEYGARRPLVGFLRPDADLREQLGEGGVDAELDAWLDAGDPPVYIGFGSMPVTDPAAALEMVSRVTSALGLRALVSAGWGRLGSDGVTAPHVRAVGAVDHDAVLPRCRIAVHHGGAGTTAAAVTAGLPSVVCSVFADQPFWGAQLERLGVGVRLRFTDLDEARLTEALQRCSAEDVARRATELGAVLRAEPPAAARAADLVEAAAS